MQNPDIDGLKLSPMSLLKIGHANLAKLAGAANNDRQRKSKATSAVQKNELFKKEDMYDQLLLLKNELNRVNDLNTKLKTKGSAKDCQLKNKDKFIDELLKSTYVMS